MGAIPRVTKQFASQISSLDDADKQVVNRTAEDLLQHPCKHDGKATAVLSQLTGNTRGPFRRKCKKYGFFDTGFRIIYEVEITSGNQPEILMFLDLDEVYPM